MTRRNLPTILLLNFIGIALFLSWYIPANHGIWFKIDSAIFYYFNQHLLSSPCFCIWWQSLTTGFSMLFPLYVWGYFICTSI